MTEPLQQSASQALMQAMGLTAAAFERRKKIVGLEPSDLVRIAQIKDLVTNIAEDCVATFFNHLAGLDEARPLLASRALVERARQLKKVHLIAMAQGDYGPTYVEQRIELGSLYARAGLDTCTFLGAFHRMLRHIGNAVMTQPGVSCGDAFESFMSLKKVAYFDLGIIVHVLVFERERVIRQQQDSIRELSTPVLQIRERLLLLPIIGVIDTQRARAITESLLRAVRENRAKVVVMDVTGVVTIDSKVANHLLQTVAAARLMGARVVVTGLSPDVAQSLVMLGIELSQLNTMGDLQGGLEEADRILGHRALPDAADVVMSSPRGPIIQDLGSQLAAATSTGGVTNKQVGRVGDTPIVGAGCFADDVAAVSTTGTGEMFIRTVAAYDVAAQMRYAGLPLEEAARRVVMDKLPAINGRGGLIAVDREGNVTLPFNTEGMYRGFARVGEVANVWIYG